MGRFKKFFKKATKGIAKAVSKVAPIASLATAIIPGGGLVPKIIDKAAKPLAKFGGAMGKIDKVKTLVGATGVNLNIPQALHPLMRKAGQPNRAVGAVRLNAPMNSQRKLIALNMTDDYHGSVDEPPTNETKEAKSKLVVKKQAGFGLWGVIILLLLACGTLMGRKRTKQ